MSKSGSGKKTIAAWSALFLVWIIGTIVSISFLAVSKTIITFLVGVVIVPVIILISALRWARKNKTERKGLRRTLMALLSLGLVAVIGLNAAVYKYHVVINQYLTKVKIDETELPKVTAEAKVVTEQIENEGIVLLENKQNALPLDVNNAREKNINIFGQASVRMFYGGSGSGAGDESANITLQQGLENAGFVVNNELTEFYKIHAPAKKKQNNLRLTGGDYTLSEPKISDISEEMLAKAEQFSDVALIVLARQGGEADDLPFETSKYGGSKDRHFLELSEAEEQLINMVTSRGFEKVIVVINAANAMELGFLDNEDIDAALLIGFPGSTGNNSIGNVLAGNVNPSGRLADTYAYDATSSPAYYNTGDFKYSNTAHKAIEKMTGEYDTFHTFVNYTEGIYVGYRYYETRYVDNATGKVDEAAYRKAVQYPFGYGLSYTSFKQEITDYQTTGDTISVEVKVTNTGNAAGKDVVQLYYTPPYYEGGIEKSHVVLGAFDKTEILEPGASETIKLEIPVEDMASYDYKNAKAYVLEAGTYEIKLMKNAHEAIDSRTYEVQEAVVYGEGHKRSSDQMTATNVFDDAHGDLTYVSRADWEGTLPKERATDKEASQALIQALDYKQVTDNPDDPDIVFADHGLTLEDVAGLEYDDPKWNDLLEQLSIEEMAKLIGFGGFGTQQVESVKKPATTDVDGPAGINNLLTGVKGTQYMNAVVLASTWNLELAAKMGETLAKEATIYRISGWYAPGMNIHRTPFSGRSFEYYSEDGYLSGKMGSSIVKGALSKGVYPHIKHFAMNDQDTNRYNVATWSNEQAIREIYLKPFEISVKEGGATAVMSAYNRIGTTWAGEHYGLLTTVLREEWGFKGLAVTDYDRFSFMVPDIAIRAGNSLMMTTLGDKPTEASTLTNTGKQAMRRASHDILYTVANSNALAINAAPYPYWLLLLGLGNVVVLGLLTLGFYKTTHRKTRKVDVKETQNF